MGLQRPETGSLDAAEDSCFRMEKKPFTVENHQEK